MITAFAGAAPTIATPDGLQPKSDEVLAELAAPLLAAGYDVEQGKRAANRLTRPVLFGENGKPTVEYDVDAFHPVHQVVLEIEAGRGAASNADFRDIVRSSLLVGVRYLALAMMIEYRGGGRPIKSYENTRNQLDAIYASERLRLPFEGVLLIGY
jgi:hypothetical protein